MSSKTSGKANNIKVCIITLCLNYLLISVANASADISLLDGDQGYGDYAEFPEENRDPWEKINRKIFVFNEKFDQKIYRPVAVTYSEIVPFPIRNVVTTFFNHLTEVRNGVSALLQLKFDQVAITSGRIIINSTVGMLGMLDVAREIGLREQYQDFGTAINHWGAPLGPYVMLPFWGPRTVTSAIGLIGDVEIHPTFVLHWLSPEYIMVNSVDLISRRAELLDAETFLVGDHYTFIRDAYLQQRRYLINGELPEDEF